MILKSNRWIVERRAKNRNDQRKIKIPMWKLVKGTLNE